MAVSEAPDAIQVTFHLDEFPHWHHAQALVGYPNCSLDTDGESLAISRSVDVEEVLYLGGHSTVYLARCSDGTELALKFTSEEQVLAEAGAYDGMSGLQGSVFPRMYGVLFGEVRRGEDIACLVLERFGNRLQDDFYTLKSADKAKILDKLVEAHHAGLHHQDFAERNVLVKDGDYRIADLGRVDLHPSCCCWDYKFAEHVGEDEYRGNQIPGDGGCVIIWREAIEMRFWSEHKLWLHESFYVSKSDELPSQYEIDRMVTKIGLDVTTRYSTSDVQELVVLYYKEVKRLLDAGQPLDVLRSHRPQISRRIHRKWHTERNLPFSTRPLWERTEDEDSPLESD